MTLGNKGTVLISKMPISRILPETDAPFTQSKGVPYMPWDTLIVIKRLTTIYNMDSTDAEQKMSINLQRLLTTIGMESVPRAF
jgi:TatD DNase family protein